MTAGNTPPGNNGRDFARRRKPSDPPAPSRDSARPSKPSDLVKPPLLSKPSFLAKPSFLSKPLLGGPRRVAGRSPDDSGQTPGPKPGEPQIGEERPGAPSRHRIASGLPPQPQPAISKKEAAPPDPPMFGAPRAKAAAHPLLAGAGQPSGFKPAEPTLRAALKSDVWPRPRSERAPFDQGTIAPGSTTAAPGAGLPVPGSTKATGAAPPSAGFGTTKPSRSSTGVTRPALDAMPPVTGGPKSGLNPSVSEPEKGAGGPKPPIPQLPMSGKVPPAPLPVRSAASPGKAAPASGRVVLGAGEPEPPISGRPIDGLGPSLMEQKRIKPRSPRAAIEPEHVQMPPRNKRASKRARNPLVIIGNAVFTILLLALVVGGTAAVFGKSRFEAPGPLQQDKVVNIPRAGMIEIADLLKREGVIDEHRIVFIGGVLALKARSDLKAGEYLFQKHASVRDVVETIVEGKVVQHQLVLPEGLTSEQIVARLLENDTLTGNIKEVPREGTLLPDGYHFNRGFPREQLLQRMRQAQERVVRDVWERRNPDIPIKTPEQLVILASIVEKETGKPEERTRIAAVFLNRLKQKMRLQSDPTIIYGLVFGKGSLGRPLSKADIAQATPYNTYVIDGLPPGPITNPGRASIEAVGNPARTKELYFVADGTGGHAFAENYEQHQKNVARLRVIEHELKEPSAPEAQTPARAPTPSARPKRGKSSSSRSAVAQ